jgi:protein NrfD
VSFGRIETVRCGLGQPPAGQADRSPDVTYYGQPALKPSFYDWRIAAYIWAGGLGGAAQLISTLAALLGGRRWSGTVRRGRDIAFASSLVGGTLLIADLKTPGRWYHMLRIVRTTSPMSIGSWILTAFGASAGAASIGQRLRGRRLGRIGQDAAAVAQYPAAVAGIGMTAYTGGLLSATSTPLWAAAPGLLSARFACAAMASGSAALSLCEWQAGHPQNAGRLDKVTLVSLASELAFSLAAERRYRDRGVAAPLEEGAWGSTDKVGGLIVGAVVPIACFAVNALRERPSPTVSIVGSVATLLGSMAMRHAVLYAGNESARRPKDYFRSARAPGRLVPRPRS